LERISPAKRPISPLTADKYKSAKTPDNTHEDGYIPKLEQKEIEVNRKQPSKRLTTLIENFGSCCTNLKNLAKEIKKKADEEGFSKLEIILLAREILGHSLSSRQLNYWFPLKRNWKDMKESSSLNPQIVNNDDKKDMDKSHLASHADVGEHVLLQSIKTCSEDTNHSDTNANVESSPGSVSYFDLTDSESINCTNHPMYQRAKKKIEQLEEALVEKKLTNPFNSKILGKKGL
jgi:hypothetical protein